MKNHLKNLPSTKNPTRLIYFSLIAWIATKIIYQFIDGWHWSSDPNGAEHWLLYAFDSLFTIGLLLHWISFKEILEVYRKQMIKCVNRMLKSEVQHNGQAIELEELIEQIQKENSKLQLENSTLRAEVEFHKGSAKGQQQRADTATSFGKTMEAANSILLQTQSRLNKTVDSQDKTIKLLVKSQLEVINNLTAPQIITQEHKPELILPGEPKTARSHEDY